MVSLRTGRVVFSEAADRRFAPASNTKLFTTATALSVLGPDRRFVTRVILRPSPGTSEQKAANGVWHGDLVIVGAGDPSLTSADLDSLARQARAAGVRRVIGALIVDGARFRGPGRGPGWGWDWESDDYAAPAAALTCDRGRVEVLVTPGRRSGDAPLIALTPASSGLEVSNEAITGPTKSALTLTVSRPHASAVVRVKGSVPAGAAEYRDAVAVEDPLRLAASVFRAALDRHGVGIEGPIRIVTGDDRPEAGLDSGVEVGLHTSAPLRTLVSEMNLPSDNHYAETLLRDAGIEWAARGGHASADADTVDLGLAAEREMLDRMKIPDDEAHLVDGSGLSRLDLVTPDAFVRLLEAIDRRPDGAIYFGSLPVAGRTGTLRRRMVGTPAVGRVVAKTGTLTGATALSGIATTRSGERLAFSILVNGTLSAAGPIRALQDRFCEALVESGSP